MTAAIPDSSGNINGCYRTIGGDLRVIDVSTTNCSNNETAIDLTRALSNSTTAYFQVKDGVVNTAAMKNITAYQWYDGNGPNGGAPGWCLQTSFEPSYGLATNVAQFGIGNSPVSAELENVGAGAYPHESCPANYNAFVPLDPTLNQTTPYIITFTK